MSYTAGELFGGKDGIRSRFLRLDDCVFRAFRDVFSTIHQLGGMD